MRFSHLSHSAWFGSCKARFILFILNSSSTLTIQHSTIAQVTRISIINTKAFGFSTKTTRSSIQIISQNDGHILDTVVVQA